nr:hypothetical protein CFP56_76303 [Quercus suber]
MAPSSGRGDQLNTNDISGPGFYETSPFTRNECDGQARNRINDHYAGYTPSFVSDQDKMVVRVAWDLTFTLPENVQDVANGTGIPLPSNVQE